MKTDNSQKLEEGLIKEAQQGKKWAQYTLMSLGRGDKIHGQDDGEWREPRLEANE